MIFHLHWFLPLKRSEVAQYCFPDVMLSRKVDWSVLAQCDSFAVEKFVETSNRKAMRCVEPMREASFNRKIENDSIWREAYRTICNSYRNLEPDFVIRHDNFGGYRLLYVGKTVVQPPFVFRRKPVGFIRPIPDGVVTNLSVMSSERTGEQLLMLGPLRFVNSDCSPNCEYDYSSDSGVVQLRVKRKLKPGDELFVKYGAEFFEFNCCLCRTCEVRTKEEVRQEMAFDLILETLIFDLCTGTLGDLAGEFDAETCRRASKRRRIKCRELVEQFNDLTRSPLSCDGSPEKALNTSYTDLFDNQATQRCENPISLTSPDVRPSLESTGAELFSDEENLTVDEETVPQSIENVNYSSCEDSDTKNFQIFRASSPVHQQVLINCSLSSITEEQSVQTILPLENEAETQSEKLFTGSKTSVDDATSLVNLFCSNFNLSDECSSSLFSLVKVLLPEDNKFPSGYSQINNIKRNFETSTRFIKKEPGNTFCVINFRFQLADILKRYLYEIIKYSDVRRKNPDKDFNSSICPLFKVRENNVVVVNLLIFTDGVNIKKSTYKKELWPIWIQVADLPPKLRSARKCIVLAALSVSDSYPSWQEVIPHVKDEISSRLIVEVRDEVYYKFVFKTRLLIADLGAKNHLLNMNKFNGYYGCQYCTAKGKTIGRTHAYYPFDQQGAIRESSVNDIYISTAETLRLKQVTNVVGVKGRSAFAGLVDGLPLTAPVDYMHCILQSVFPDVLKSCYQSLASQEKDSVNTLISELSCPRELISFSRRVRSLEEVSQFKANEMFNWLFYLSPIVFFRRISDSLYSHLSNLVFGIRLIFESCSADRVSEAEKFLQQFCQEIVSINGDNERKETINVHNLRHLPDQVSRFGPLFCQSAMSFEAANRSLGEVFSGSNSECEIICRRLLQRHKLQSVEINDARLCPLYSKLSGNPNKISGPDDFVETEALLEGRQFYTDGVFSNRQWHRNVYFDSPAYKKSKQGNCFVSFFYGNEEFFGKIQYFVKFPNAPFFGKIFAVVTKLVIVEDIGLVRNIFFQVQPTDEELLIPIEILKKVLFVKISKETSSTSVECCFIVKLLDVFEHS